MSPAAPVNRLVIQRLPSRGAQVLAIAHLAALGQRDGWFAPADISALFEQLRIPPPGNVSQELARLRGVGHVVRRKTIPAWSISPKGEQALITILGELPAAPIGAGTGTELGERHQLIPPALAPHAWQLALAALNEKHPFERNVFLMTRFPTRADDPLTGVIRTAQKVCALHGFNLLRADDQHADPILPSNVFAHMWASQYGLALLEVFGDPPRKSAALNENLILEVGGMLMTGRRCAILRDAGVQKVPTDLVAHIYHQADFRDLDAVEPALHHALVKDFGASRCPGCP